jgi:hypothetical protein
MTDETIAIKAAFIEVAHMSLLRISFSRNECKIGTLYAAFHLSNAIPLSGQ